MSSNKGNVTRCKRNFIRGPSHTGVDRIKIRRALIFNGSGFKKRSCSKNKFFFTSIAIFGILITIGVQLQSPANYVFAEINVQSADNQSENNATSSMPTEETKSNSSVDSINPFDSFIEGENHKTRTDLIFPDIIGSDIISEPKYNSKSNESSFHLNQQISNSMANDSNDVSNIDNANDSFMIESNNETKNKFNLTSTETPLAILQNNGLGATIADGNTVTDEMLSSENLQSKIDSQPINMSFQSYMINNDTSTISEGVIGHDDSEDNEPALMNLSINPYIGKSAENDDLVENYVPHVVDSSNINNQSEFTDLENQGESYRKYDSYRDFIDKNILNRNGNKTFLSEEIKESESNTLVNNITTNTTIKQAGINTNNHNHDNKNDSTIQTYSTSVGSSQISGQSSGKTHGDFNGDGIDDLAIGVPFEDVGSSQYAGAVEVIYGSPGGLSATIGRADQFWTQDTPEVADVSERGDSFGRAVSSGDFNGDGFDDLAIGVPGEYQGNIVDSGGVHVIYGSPNGLSATTPRPDQFWTQDTPDVEGGVELDDNFGSSLTVGDFNGDGIDDLAIGVPNEDIGTVKDAGGVQVIYGSPKGLSATTPRPDQFWTQDNPDVDGASEPVDLFGDSLSSGDFNGDGVDDVAVGIPGEDIGNVGEAGAVQVIYGSSSGLSATLAHSDQFWSQDSSDIENGAELNDLFGSAVSAGDYNGDGIDDLAIGVPAEDLGPTESAGAVQTIYGSTQGLSATLTQADQFWTQDNPEMASVSGPFENFGVTLSSGDFNDDGKDDLVIGIPGEDISSVVEAGAAQVIYGSPVGLSPTVIRPDQFWTQDTLDVDNGAEIGDLFGASLSSGDFDGNGMDDLVVGVPAEDLGNVEDAGAVQVLYGSSKGVSATLTRPDQFWTQDTIDIEASAGDSDSLGSALG